MFICTFSEEKKIDLEIKGFKLVCKQNHGDKVCYTFNFKQQKKEQDATLLL